MANPPQWEILLPVDRPDANPEWYRIQFAEGEYLYVFGSVKAGRLAVDCVNSALARHAADEADKNLWPDASPEERRRLRREYDALVACESGECDGCDNCGGGDDY